MTAAPLGATGATAAVAPVVLCGSGLRDDLWLAKAPVVTVLSTADQLLLLTQQGFPDLRLRT